MSAESAASTHIAEFRWWVGNPDLSKGEAELRDIAALRDAVDAAIALHVRTLVQYEGMSWTAAADALGMSPSAASRRYGR